jgi:hypothetical protein
VIVFNCIRNLSAIPPESTEEHCLQCINVSNRMFIKKLWFPLAPPEYVCMNYTKTLSRHNIIVEVICKVNESLGISHRNPSRIVNPANISCYLHEEDFFIHSVEVNDHGTSSSQWRLCWDIGEAVFLIIVCLVLIVRGRHNIMSVLQSIYNKSVNSFELLNVNTN